MASYWIDTLVLKTEGNTYATLLHHPFLFKGKTNASSRGSTKLVVFESVDSRRKFLACGEKVRPSFVVTNHLLDVIQSLSWFQPIHTTPSTKRILRQCHSLYLVS